MSRSSVSVAMATYNGARHVREQLDSILAQLAPGDEVVVVDDASSDDTVAVVNAIGDPRVRVHPRDHNLGYVRTFEEAVGLTTGDVVMLSDQDDLWVEGRVDALLAALDRTDVVASGVVLLPDDAPLPSPFRRRPWRLDPATSTHRRRNGARMLAGLMPYYGCAMAVRRSALPIVLPLPPWLTESHDLWIATVGNVTGQMTHVAAPTVRRRIHEANASSSRPRGVRAALVSRVLQVRMWREARRRARVLRRAA
ncbi:glycosyltransferase [Aeromicrobium alkaliterrae]|uniref:Glycosyltransferase 2-like domain-containing protein n=1 Tax=Aeromicrobium alkaliterrae TaxID=302168 RepID=A0ABN2JE52_9ACTN